MLHHDYWYLAGPYHFVVISPRNPTPITRLFLTSRRTLAGHETTYMPLKSVYTSLYPVLSPCSPPPLPPQLEFNTTLYSRVHEGSMATVVFRVWYAYSLEITLPTIRVLMTYCNTVWWEGLGKINATLAASAYKGWLTQFNALPGFTLVNTLNWTWRCQLHKP